MMYYANPSTPEVRKAMSEGLLNCIITPKQGNRIPEGAYYCADNGCFGKGYPGDAEWWAWASSLPVERCLFIVAPDVVADAQATMARSLPWLSRIRSLGAPAAFVAQDGLEALAVPWDWFDVLFIGGSTEWKLGEHAARLSAEAKARGKAVHMGRVNSLKRLRHADSIGCDSADGTFIAYGPDKNLPTMLRWVGMVNDEREQAAA